MTEKPYVWRESKTFWLMTAAVTVLLLFSYFDAIKAMMYIWDTREEYGYGYIVPFIIGFLIWQKKNLLEVISFPGSWNGVILLAFGLFCLLVGEISTIYVIQQYGLMLGIMGFILAYMGIKGFKVLLVPLALLFFMIPLPVFLLQGLSGKLQLISSEIGVYIIRLFDISVFLEGNVIDLGIYQLQVVEACSGLNYLFPLMTLGFITAYFFTGAFWKKAIIFLSTIPITVFMNSFRIGVIGITVENWGIEMAEGFLHDFEGWAVFMSCIGILIIEMWVLARIGKDKLPLTEAFGLDFPEPEAEDAEIRYRKIPKQFYVSFGLLVIMALSFIALPDREEIIPERKQFAEFPLELNDWSGRKGSIEQVYIDTLKFTDYVMNDYRGVDGSVVNFYTAYYDSQKSGVSAHSPRSCIPGGGWEITSLENYIIKGVDVGAVPLVVNRLLIEKGEIKQLVYYWFQQRGRIVTNEYMMKWYLFWDSITKSRTDGALIRLTAILNNGQDIKIADDRLESFAREVSPIIPEYVAQ